MLLSREIFRLLMLLKFASTSISLKSNLDINKIKVISFDVTGTLLVHRYPIARTYAEAAIWAKLPNPPSESELKIAFKSAYHELSQKSRCFGYHEKISSREWWRKLIRLALSLCDKNYSDRDFDRYFRRIYQHFGSTDGYEPLEDAGR